MKKTNIFAAATAMVMALASLPVVSASAGETFQPGDVDMDGVITGHDSAVVSRSLYEEDASLTAEQIALADINGDNIVDQADLEWIHGQEEYFIGNVFLDEEKDWVNQLDAYIALAVSSWEHVGYKIVLSPDAVPFRNSSELFSDNEEGPTYPAHMESDGSVVINQVQYNLLDSNGDGKVTAEDALNTLLSESYYAASSTTVKYFVEGRYDLVSQYYYLNEGSIFHEQNPDDYLFEMN